MRSIAKTALGGIMPALAALTLAGCDTVAPAPSPYLYAARSAHVAPQAGSWLETPPSTYLPIYEAPEFARNYGPSWSHDLTHDAITAGATVGGLEAMQRLKAAQAPRAVAMPAPELPTPAAEGAAGAAGERKLAGKLLTREGTAVAERAAEEKITGKLLMRGALVAEEGEGLWVLVRLLPFL